jgi:hypothetical protein
MSPSTQITRDNLIEWLHNSVPDFAINPDWRDGTLGYPIMNDLARFICDRAGTEEFEQVTSAVRFLEAGLEIGDEYVRDVISEALETLAACDHITAVQGYFGPRALDLWRTIRQAF